MAATRFATTRLSELRAAGRLQELQHATVAPFLERELGPEYGRLFADFEAESSDVRAWYTDAAAPPRSIATLSEPDAEALRQRVADMVGRIGAFAARIAGESTQKANLARILTAATTFPVEDIWDDGGQPIIVNWGFHRHDVESGVPRPIRDRMGRTSAARPLDPGPAGVRSTAAVTAAPAAAPARPARRRWFILPAVLWLVFLAFTLASYDLLLPACGLAGPFGMAWLGACPRPGDGAQLFAEGAELQALVDAAELETSRQRALCGRPRHAELRRVPEQTTAAAGH